MQVSVADIIVKKRIRRDMGDIPALAESMKRFGQLSPIVITSSNVLISGGRRLEAAKSLGWRTISASITEVPEHIFSLEYEIEENLQRRDFAPEELAEATRKLYRLKHPGFFRRIWNAIAGFFKSIFRIHG